MKVPSICKGCWKSRFFKKGECNMYWKEKGECVSYDNNIDRENT